MFKRQTIVVFLTLNVIFVSTNTHALPQDNPVPGGIKILALEKSDATPLPKVTFRKRPVMVVKHADQWHAVVGLPLSLKPGLHNVEVTVTNEIKQLDFTVKSTKYKTQHITLKNKRQVNPNKKDMTRINLEKKKTIDALQTWSDQDNVQLDFILPVKGHLSSPFGLRRYFNKQPRKPHSGIDIAAPKGTPLKSPAGAKVISTGHYFFNGNTVFLDHGQGLITMYCHMDRIDVKPGQLLNQGDVFGAIGMTGRATGPHVHWSVSLNDARVDPKLFFKPKVYKTLLKKK